MKLVDKVVQKLALRWAKGKVETLRGKKRETGMGKLLKALDGWKLVIFVLALAGAKAWDMAHNGHAGDAIGIALSLLGYTQGADWAVLARDMGVHLGALAAIGHKVIKAQRQMKAGATLGETLSPVGAIKAAVADGSLVSLAAPGEAPASTQIRLDGVRVA